MHNSEIEMPFLLREEKEFDKHRKQNARSQESEAQRAI
jgi:hypothetical protein